MFSFFRKKPPAPPAAEVASAPAASGDDAATPRVDEKATSAPAAASWWSRAVGRITGDSAPSTPAPTQAEPASVEDGAVGVTSFEAPIESATPSAAPAARSSTAGADDEADSAPWTDDDLAAQALAATGDSPHDVAAMGQRADPHADATLPAVARVADADRPTATPASTGGYDAAAAAAASVAPGLVFGAAAAAPEAERPRAAEAPRDGWIGRLKQGLRRTGGSLTQVFTGTRIDEALYEQLEEALLLADAGPKATEYLLADLKRRVKDAKATEPAAVKALLAQAIEALLLPLEGHFEVGRHVPTVAMVVGVNGAGKTTTIGKLTRHLAEAYQRVLLVAGDTFRAAAREQLAAWATRNEARVAASGIGRVDIVSQQGADPAAVSFDAIAAAQARRMDVVIVDTAGRLPTQLHLMEELKKIKRVIGKADALAPHEVLLVVDGNTGQNALAQLKAFDEALGVTGLVVTKLDGTAKGGVLAAIALWSRERQQKNPALRPVGVYYIGVGETLEDLQIFKAREFAQALLG